MCSLRKIHLYFIPIRAQGFNSPMTSHEFISSRCHDMNSFLFRWHHFNFFKVNEYIPKITFFRRASGICHYNNVRAFLQPSCFCCCCCHWKSCPILDNNEEKKSEWRLKIPIFFLSHQKETKHFFNTVIPVYQWLCIFHCCSSFKAWLYFSKHCIVAKIGLLQWYC